MHLADPVDNSSQLSTGPEPELVQCHALAIVVRQVYDSKDARPSCIVPVSSSLASESNTTFNTHGN